MTEIELTPLAERQFEALAGRRRKAMTDFLGQLRALGCAAMSGVGGYRLTGDEPVNRLCCKHLYGDDRAIVGFDEPNIALVIMIGPHATRSKLDVYANLWLACGLDEPPVGPRDKPSCCESDSGPPFMLPDDIREMVARLKSLTRSLT